MESLEIMEVKAREILDCRGFPTVQVDIITRGGILGRADAPVGKSTGKHEAFELRDCGERYHGRGVHTAVENVNSIIAPQLHGIPVTMQREIDKVITELDGTQKIIDILRTKFDPVLQKKALCGDLAIYFDGKDAIKHIGIVGNQGRVCSKFNCGHVYLHLPEVVIVFWYLTLPAVVLLSSCHIWR